MGYDKRETMCITCLKLCKRACGLVISYIMGFIFTHFSLKDADVANA